MLDTIITIITLCCASFACLMAGLWFAINFLSELRTYRREGRR